MMSGTEISFADLFSRHSIPAWSLIDDFIYKLDSRPLLPIYTHTHTHTQREKKPSRRTGPMEKLMTPGRVAQRHIPISMRSFKVDEEGDKEMRPVCVYILCIEAWESRSDGRLCRQKF